MKSYKTKQKKVLQTCISRLFTPLILAMCLTTPLQAKTTNLPTTTNAPTDIVQTAHVFTTALPWFGQVESGAAVTITARTTGLIVSIGAADESAVKQGDVLFTLAGKSVESRSMDLRQQLVQSNREVAIAQKNLRLKRSQRQQGLATNEQVNVAENALSLAHAHASSARQAMASLHISSRIVAPVDGVFTGRAVYIGQYVSIGMNLARIINTHHSRIRASLFPPVDVNLTGRTAVIHRDGGDIRGTVSATMPETTAEGGTRIWIDGDAVQTLMPGMQISGAFILTHQGIAVPESAIARDDAGKSYVFIRDGASWRKQQVATGIHDHGWVEIHTGLHGGETIAAAGTYEMLYGDFGNSYHEAD